ncbi:hypothetical protein [Candidatus Contubernalis alkaliaceticus]|uniref:hypothetical protein n=1 Tax=Candidatus Contubernalis alkaliaceticus TaxID=338645 RepID=UPI001F4C1EE6|nr:hypothetical protein [Candidatus Contubernalis alkalaceticus]UNC92831.1 hypothetical protein HUE98_12425 [Candidatus Contubernalis alkalaceticus]
MEYKTPILEDMNMLKDSEGRVSTQGVIVLGVILVGVYSVAAATVFVFAATVINKITTPT